MTSNDHVYFHDTLQLNGYLSYNSTTPSPAVLVVHDWSGRNEFACQKADMLANIGYVGFAVDMYGEGKVGETIEEKQSLMQPFLKDRVLLRDRLMSAIHVVRTMDMVDANKIALIGFCFGGLCVLDIARSGLDIKGVVSLHGILNPPAAHTPKTIKAKVLALHGYDDPMVPPEQVHAFCQEMSQAKADWQLHMYGHTKHAFTNPSAHDNAMGTVYNVCANQRAMLAMTAFLSELFNE